jgi:osmotically-inducible protein OsmY
LGQNVETRGLSRPNVSSCSFVVTLHGRAGGAEERRAIEEVVRRVPGLPGVVNKLIARLQ